MRKLKEYSKNSISLAILKKATEAKDESVIESYQEKIREALGIKNKLTMILNNKVQPSFQELVQIAGILGVSVDELIQKEATPSKAQTYVKAS